MIYTFLNPDIHKKKTQKDLEEQLLELPSLNRIKTTEHQFNDLPDMVIERNLSTTEGLGEEISMDDIFQINFKIQPAIACFISNNSKSPKHYLILFLLCKNPREIDLKLKRNFIK